MKGCFFLQRRFAYVGHVMAILLKERYHLSEFCGYVTLRSSFSFLQAQTDVPFTQLILEEDIIASYKNEVINEDYIHYLEKEFGIPNLWPFIMADRVLRYNLLVRAYPSDTSLYSHEDMIKMTQVLAKAIIAFFEEEKPDFIIFAAVGNLGSMLLYHIAKKKHIKTIIIDSPRIGIRYFVSERYDQSTYLAPRFQHLIQQSHAEETVYFQQAKQFLSDFQKKPYYFLNASQAAKTFSAVMSLDWRSHFQFLLPRKLLRSIHWTAINLLSYILNTHKDDYIIIKPWHEFIDKAKRKLRIIKGYSDLYDELPPDEIYAYFALHTEPEAYPMILASFYTDQIWLIKQVARSLPLTYKLYVKDHPCMVGYRPRWYYQELKKIPNVRLVNPSVSGLQLIQKSRLTLTITGTSGWEAILLKKPVIIFGNMYYDQLSGVKKCVAIQDLPFLIKAQLEHFFYNETEVLTFITAALQESVDVDLVEMWDVDGDSKPEKKREKLVPLIDLIADKLGLSRMS